MLIRRGAELRLLCRKILGSFVDLQVAQPVRARVELLRVCLVLESSAKRWVPPWVLPRPRPRVEGVPADLEDAVADEELKGKAKHVSSALGPRMVSFMCKIRLDICKHYKHIEHAMIRDQDGGRGARPERRTYLAC